MTTTLVPDTPAQPLWDASVDRFDPPQASEPPQIRRSRWGVLDIVVTLVLFVFLQIAATVLAIVVWSIANRKAVLGADDTATYIIDKLPTITTVGSTVLISSLGMYVAWMLGMWVASKYRGLGSWAKDYWVTFKGKDIIIGLVAAAILRLFEIFALMPGLKALGLNLEGADNSSTVANMSGVWWTINALIIASIVAPVMEELFFRGFVMNGLARTFTSAPAGDEKLLTDSLPVSVNTYAHIIDKAVGGVSGFIHSKRYMIAAIMSSAFFGVMHWQGTETFGQILVPLWTGFIGFIFALIVIKTKRLGAVIFAHIFFNLSGVLLATFL